MIVRTSSAWSPQASVSTSIARFVSWSLCTSSAASSRAAADEKPWPRDWLVGGFDKTSRWVTAGLLLGLGGYYATADTEDVRDLGDITQILPGVAAVGLTIGVGDWQGLKEFGLAAGTGFVITHGIKETVDKTRPDTSANNSFPSGHTSASVTGAAFIWRRYGPKWGAPASLFAAYTALSRVEGQKHFVDDVISGAAIGLISNWLWTNPVDERVQMALFPTQGGAGFNMSIDMSKTAETPAGNEREGRVPRRYFLWEIGGSDVTHNQVVAPNPGGTPIDFRFNEENDPTTTAFVLVNWSTRDQKHDLYGVYAPFEIREVVETEDDIVLGGTLIPAGTTIQTRYLAYDFRVGANWAFVTRPRYRLTAGASLAAFFTEVGAIDAEDLDASTSVTAYRPTLDLGFDAALGKRWLAFAFVNFWSDSSVEIVDATAQIAYQLHPKWALSLGYRRVERKVATSKLFTDVDRNQVALGVYYIW